MTEDSADLLSEVMSVYQVRASVSDVFEVCGAWRYDEPQLGRAYLHLILDGESWLRQAGSEPLRIGPDDLVVFPRGTAHVMLPYAPPGQLARTEQSCTMLCSEIDFLPATHNPLLAALPDMIVVNDQEAGSRFRQVAQLLRDEKHAARPGSQALVDRLCDALFVMAVRHHVSSTTRPQGLIAAMREPRLGRALSAMHREIARDWTVADLATEAHMSRTAFAEHFSSVLGQTPIHYLTELRIALAERLLQQPRATVAQVAGELGYQTEAAFRKAFKRLRGVGPGSVRRGGVDKLL
ncbi:MAG TPA: AraC family transcriptional regulator [Solimonas sp.]|nr:AraC family transcriptional regulator [Solimonas sp.]